MPVPVGNDCVENVSSSDSIAFKTISETLATNRAAKCSECSFLYFASECSEIFWASLRDQTYLLELLTRL